MHVQLKVLMVVKRILIEPGQSNLYAVETLK